MVSNMVNVSEIIWFLNINDVKGMLYCIYMIDIVIVVVVIIICIINFCVNWLIL